MALRGVFISMGYIRGVGLCQIFQDVDSTQYVFAKSKKDQWRYLRRSRIQFRKAAKK